MRKLTLALSVLSVLGIVMMLYTNRESADVAGAAMGAPAVEHSASGEVEQREPKGRRPERIRRVETAEQPEVRLLPLRPAEPGKIPHLRDSQLATAHKAWSLFEQEAEGLTDRQRQQVLRVLSDAQLELSAIPSLELHETEWNVSHEFNPKDEFTNRLDEEVLAKVEPILTKGQFVAYRDWIPSATSFLAGKPLTGAARER